MIGVCPSCGERILDAELRDSFAPLEQPDVHAPRVRLNADPSPDGTHAALHASRPGGSAGVWVARLATQHDSAWGPRLRSVHDCSKRPVQLDLLGAA